MDNLNTKTLRECGENTLGNQQLTGTRSAHGRVFNILCGFMSFYVLCVFMPHFINMFVLVFMELQRLVAGEIQQAVHH